MDTQDLLVGRTAIRTNRGTGETETVNLLFAVDRVSASQGVGPRRALEMLEAGPTMTHGYIYSVVAAETDSAVPGCYCPDYE